MSHARRTATVPAELGGKPLDGAVRALFGLTWGKARAFVERGKVTVGGDVVVEGDRRVRAGAVLELDPARPAPARASDLGSAALVHVDAQVVVVRKPSGISTVPFDENETGTLDERVRAILSKRGSGGGRPNLGVVHRIDKETSGLVVFTRTWLAKQSLTQQFREHTVVRRYLAIVHGAPATRTFRSHLIADRGDGLRGSWEARPRKSPKAEGQLAVTHVKRLERRGAASLVECRLETGRTHQIRIHLSEAGHPLVGERVYVRNFAGEPIAAPRLMLHAAVLGFVHPSTGEDVLFEDPMPDDMARVWAKLSEGARTEGGE
ncbi:MAG: RluA family pseudouridine synthase [Myxococcales bacterium]|jgi:23S rRNA pseudouridine1911/1915/1917 synthase|nr:RluA family pseudouridine synthase [Myxococcales bacterium]